MFSVRLAIDKCDFHTADLNCNNQDYQVIAGNRNNNRSSQDQLKSDDRAYGIADVAKSSDRVCDAEWAPVEI